MSSQLVAGLDIGSSKTAVVIAELDSGGGALRVLGVGQARTSGIRREIVTDIEATTESVRKAVKEAELMAGVTVESLYTGIAGEHIHGQPSTGVVAVAGREISARDVDRVHEVAQAVVVPADREILHAIPQEYMVDGQGGIKDPVNMAGTRLEAEVYMITGSASAAQNVRKSVDRAGYSVAGLVLEQIASSLSVVSEDEKELGVVMVELGGGTTDLIVWHERKIRHLATLPWGGGTVTNDIVKGLSLPYAEAARAKESWGAAQANLVDPREVFEVQGSAGSEPREIARELLAHIIEQRMDEIFGLVAEQIERSGFGNKLAAGVVLTGGGAALEGVASLAEQTFPGRVRIGMPGDAFDGLADAIRRSRFATASGLALFGAHQIALQMSETATGSGASMTGMIRWVRDWLTDFF